VSCVWLDNELLGFRQVAEPTEPGVPCHYFALSSEYQSVSHVGSRLDLARVAVRRERRSVRAALFVGFGVNGRGARAFAPGSSLGGLLCVRVARSIGAARFY
jgi:hypothetical protein